ncbi:hypothetical protein Nmel_017445 [Mimus melanotis]
MSSHHCSRSMTLSGFLIPDHCPQEPWEPAERAKSKRMF